MDLALSLGKPFAVVPCCVYSRCFPGRRGPGGEEVRTYDQFVAYLIAKSPGISCAELPFEGRNKVVYGDPRGTTRLGP